MVKKRSRQSHTGSVYQSGGYWWAAVMINGARRRMRATSRTEASAKLLQLRKDVEKSAGLELATFGGFKKRWLQHIGGKSSPNTLDAYTTSMVKFKRLDAYQLRRVTGLMIQQVLDGLSGRTAQQAYDKCKQMLKMAVKWNCLSQNPMDGLDRPEHTKKKIEPFTIDEIDMILKHLKGHRYEAAVHIAFSCGLRIGELFGLQWSDLVDSELSIHRQASERASGVLEIRQPKTASSIRRILLSDSAIELLVERRKKAMKEGNGKSPWIFPNRDGGVSRRGTFTGGVWRACLLELGIPSRGFHHTRHTAATLLLNSGGVPLSVVAKILGHANPSITLKIYAHVMTSDLSQHRNAFDAIRKRA